MRLCGIILTMIFSFALFRKRACFYRTRVNEIRTITEMTDRFEAEISYNAIPTGEVMLKLSETPSFDRMEIISDCAKRIKSGESFHEAMSICAVNSKSTLNKEERELLYSFAVSLGQGDLDNEIKCCRYYNAAFAKRLQEAHETERLKGVMLTRLGLITAAAIFILFI